MYIAETGIIVGTRDSTKTMWSSWLEWIPWRTNFRTVWRQPMMASGTPRMHFKYVFHFPNPTYFISDERFKFLPQYYVVYMSYFYLIHSICRGLKSSPRWCQSEYLLRSICVWSTHLVRKWTVSQGKIQRFIVIILEDLIIHICLPTISGSSKSRWWSLQSRETTRTLQAKLLGQDLYYSTSNTSWSISRNRKLYVIDQNTSIWSSNTTRLVRN